MLIFFLNYNQKNIRLTKSRMAYIISLFLFKIVRESVSCLILRKACLFSIFYFLLILECFVYMCKWIMCLHCCLWRPEEGIRPLELQLEVVGDHMVLGTKSGSSASASVSAFLNAETSLQSLLLFSRACPHLYVYHAQRAGQS